VIASANPDEAALTGPPAIWHLSLTHSLSAGNGKDRKTLPDRDITANAKPARIGDVRRNR